MTVVATCPTCGLNYACVNGALHKCPPSVQPCGACGGSYDSQHVCLAGPPGFVIAP